MHKSMFKIKKTYYLYICLIIGSFVLYIIPGIGEYLEWNRAVEAIGECPWQEGGVVTKFTGVPCVLDPGTPAGPFCMLTCPLLSTPPFGVGSLCQFYAAEIGVAGQMGTKVIGISSTNPPKFYGIPPATGQQFIACGASPYNPWILGFPSPFVVKLHNISNWLKVHIAGIKN